jgi:hypothetical protein
MHKMRFVSTESALRGRIRLETGGGIKKPGAQTLARESLNRLQQEPIKWQSRSSTPLASRLFTNHTM